MEELYEEIGFFGFVIICNDDEVVWKINLKICGKIVIFKIDLGVDILVMGELIYYVF